MQIKEIIMRVILTKDVKNLGKIGDVKEVKDGYGQNFLIGKGFARLASNVNLKRHESKQMQLKRENDDNKDKKEKLKIKLEETEYEINHKIGANGSLYGAITKIEIASFLNEKLKQNIDKKNIIVDKAIKSTGLFDVKIKLGFGIVADIKINIKGI
jgi:large subunit ribosomal protein L9